MASLLVFAVAVLGAVHSGKACPCKPESLCGPLVPERALVMQTKWEVFAFALKSNWTDLDWSVVTTVAWFGTGDPSSSDICLAHSHGARVVLQGALGVIPGDISNATARAAGVAVQLARSNRIGTDGINLDIEGYAGDKAALTAYVKELSTAFRAAIPSAQISFDLSVSPAGQTDHYDHAALAGHLDFIVPMAYDEDWGSLKPRANSPLQALPNSVKQYAALGVTPDKLLYALPWYGGVWPCDNPKHATPCQTNLHGKAWDTIVGRQGYNSVFEHIGHDNTTAVVIDHETMTKTFEFVSAGTRYVTFMDDGETLLAKVAALRLATGSPSTLRGVAMWYAECVDGLSKTEVASMWHALYPSSSPRAFAHLIAV